MRVIATSLLDLDRVASESVVLSNGSWKFKLSVEEERQSRWPSAPSSDVADGHAGPADASFRELADQSSVMMWITDREGQCVFLNRSWYEFTGQTEAEGEGYGWLEATHPDDRDEAEQAFRDANASQAAFRVEYRLRAKDGTYCWAIDAASPRRGADGAFLGYIGSVLDIEGRRQAEEALARSEARYRTLFASIESGFCVVEVMPGTDDRPSNYRVIEANPAFYHQTGFPETILGQWLREAAPTLEEHWFEIYEKVVRTGRAERFEEGSAALGRYFDVYAFRIGAREDHRVAIMFNDISARRNAELAVQRLNERLEQEVVSRTAERDRMWEMSPDLMVVLSQEGHYKRINPAWKTVLDYEPEDVIGRFATDFTHPADLEATQAALVVAQSGPMPIYEYRFRHKDGSYRWIQWVAAQGADEIFAIGRHVTAEREQADALSKAEAALRQSQKMEAVGQLTGGLAHDFNNLLAGISGSLELMQKRISAGRSEEAEKYIDGAQGATKRAAALTHRLLAFSRRQTLAPEPTDIARLIAEMQDLIQRTVGPAIAVETPPNPHLWSTLVDQNQLENALLNLCINARDAMPEGGRLTIEASNCALDRVGAAQRDLPEGDYVALAVTDNGVGMSRDVIDRAFEPFFTTKPIGLGTGLGLSMVFGFAKQSGGQVRVHSDVGAGTTVSLMLPRHDTIETAQDVEGLNEFQHRATSEQAVLVVDDEPLVRSLIVDVLEELGYRALEAADGPEAMLILRSGREIDLLVTDVGLPNGMNGRQVADAARELRPELSILFVTGYADTAVLSHGDLLPGMAVLTKPFTMTAMAERIQSLMPGSSN